MVDYSRYRTLLIEKSDNGVCVVTMNRPEKRNAVNLQMHQELEQIWLHIAEDDEVRCIVLTGAGPAFCAGGDVEGMETGSFRPQGPRVPFYMVRRLISNLLEVEQPIVAAVNGDAAGLGATLALFCDIIVMSETARIADTHVRMGLVAGDGGVIIWPWLVGMARAKEFLLTGRWVDGREAERLGLVNYAVPADQVMPKAMEIAHILAQGAPMAIRWTKYAMNKVLREHVNLALDSSMFLEAMTMSSEDLQEAARAFRERRRPQFKGR
ncbi:MAG: enoyl-CoA hydratase-related protein [Dehalococcoidia bacterium]|jgi:enoyl-CoA hydratase|nr:enoyl-CoA hydratase-related protein [Dehalococcoidia bacterium]